MMDNLLREHNLNQRDMQIIADAMDNGCIFMCAYDESSMFGRFDYSYTQLEKLIDAGWLIRHGWGDVIRQRFVASDKTLKLVSDLDKQSKE